jgi:hypothetical protein
MRGFSASVVLVVATALCCAHAWGQPSFMLTSDDLTPEPGDTLTFTLSFYGDGLGLIMVRYDALLTGAATWDVPTNPTILHGQLDDFTNASPGTPAADGVHDVILAIDYLGFPWDQVDIGASGWEPVWSTQVTVTGDCGDPFTLTARSELDPDPPGAGMHAFFSDGSYIDTQTTLAALTLTVRIEGDADEDNDVDFDDFSTLAFNFGSSGGWSDGDFDGDGDIDFDDFSALAFNYGQTCSGPAPAAGSAAAPEPLTLGLLALGGTALLLRRRRKS